jgi:hypothetical protein
VPIVTNDIANTSIVLFPGGHQTFSIVAVGAQPLHYQWFSNNVAVANATNSGYTLLNAQPPNSTNTFYCLVTNIAGSASSSVATVVVLLSPIASYPVTIMAANPFGFWRLNEAEQGNGDNGVVANDYAGGNAGIYTNTTLSQPGYNPNEPSETSAEFGANSFQDGDVFNIPTNVDFSAPTNSNSPFTIEAWAKGYQQTVDAGVVSKGYGSGGEQFNLDCGSDATNAANPIAHSYRFFVRDAASGATHAVSSSVNPNDGLWHYLAGVCDESNGYVAFYIDGALVGTNTITPGSGILSSPRHMLIGSRPSNSTTNNNDSQFVGWVDDVAVYNRALSAAEVLNHFNSADIPANVVIQPTDVTACQNGTATFTGRAEGTPPLSYQWYDANLNVPILGATSPTLVVNNVQFTDSYYLLVTNPFGTNQSRNANLTVISGQPQVLSEPQAQYFVLRGGTISIPVTVLGTLPLMDQWQVSDTNALVWTNLTDNARIAGSQQTFLNMTNEQSSILTIANVQNSDAGDYRLATANASGSSLSSIANLIVGSLPISFNGDGVGWGQNQSGSYSTTPVVDGVWTGTENTGNESRSLFLQYPQYIGAFKASFTYQDVSTGGADGVCFVLQNDPRGSSALGGGGGNLGVSGITPSWELELNIYSGTANGLGYNLFTNGINGANLGLGNISLGNGDPIDISMYYANGQLSLTFTDAVSTASFTTNRPVGDLTKVVGGSTAYIGFTAADGGSSALQLVSNFSFVSIPSQTILPGGTNAVIIWPGSVPGYVLQQNTNLVSPNWVYATNQDTIVNGFHQVTVPISGRQLFYRLILAP